MLSAFHTFNSPVVPGKDVVIISPIYHTGKLRLSEVGRLAQGHTEIK